MNDVNTQPFRANFKKMYSASVARALGGSGGVARLLSFLPSVLLSPKLRLAPTQRLSALLVIAW